MDVLAEHQEALEEAIYYRISDLFNLDVELIFYDTTSLHFEIEQEDSSEAGAQPALRKRGYSKNDRGDAPQVVIGLAVTRDGCPVRHWVFPGNTVDVSTVEKVKRELRGWRLNRCVWGCRDGIKVELAGPCSWRGSLWRFLCTQEGK